MEIATVATQVTMTSLELVEFINGQRKEGESELRHDNFMAKVPIVLGKDGVLNFKDTYIHPQNGQSYPCYRLPKREACLMAMSYSYDLQAKVFDRMTTLESQTVPKIPQTLAQALRLAADQAEQIEAQQAALSIAAPKVAVYELLADRKGDVSTTIVAKEIGITAVKMNKFLREKGVKWLNADLPKAGFETWFNIVADIKNDHEFTQCLITPKGQIEIAELWNRSQEK